MTKFSWVLKKSKYNVISREPQRLSPLVMHPLLPHYTPHSTRQFFLSFRTNIFSYKNVILTVVSLSEVCDGPGVNSDIKNVSILLWIHFVDNRNSYTQKYLTFSYVTGITVLILNNQLLICKMFNV